MKKTLALLLALGLTSAVAHAQGTYLTRDANDSFGRGADNPASSGGRSLFGVVHSDQFKITNETSFSVLSGGGGSLTQGLNVTRLSYQPNSPLRLSVGLGNMFMSSGSYFGYSAKPGFFLHDLSLQYKAGEHSIFNIQFQQAPGRRSGPRDVYGYGVDPDPFPFGH